MSLNLASYSTRMTSLSSGRLQDLGEGGLSPNKSPKKSGKAFEGAGKDKGKRCAVEAAVSVATEQTKGRGRPKGKGL